MEVTMTKQAMIPNEQDAHTKLRKVSKPFTDACFTCKKRRVKCDMTKPFCNTCKSKKNLVCEGFDVKLRWSDPIEFDIYGDISANPKNSKILDSDNKDPQYQRRKIKYLHYKEEYQYYDEMDDELTALNKVLAQHQAKIMDGETWIIKKFGVFEGISYAKIQYQRRLKKQKIRILKKKQQQMEKEMRHKVLQKNASSKLKKKPIKKNSISKSTAKNLKESAIDKNHDHEYSTDDRAHKNAGQKQVHGATDQLLGDNDSKFFTDFFDNLQSPFPSNNSGLVKKGFIPATPIALNAIQKPSAKNLTRTPNFNHSINNGNTEWNKLPAFLEDIFQAHHDSLEMDHGSVHTATHELLSSKESVAATASLPLVSGGDERAENIHEEPISSYYKDNIQPAESLDESELPKKSISQIVLKGDGYSFLTDSIDSRPAPVEPPKDTAVFLSPNENSLALDIKSLEKTKQLLRQEVDMLLLLKQRLLSDMADLTR
ncbi:hypothetical protein QEN19_003532 [Hanseniaspora menglaensis]